MKNSKAAASADVVEGAVRACDVEGQKVLLTRVKGKLCAFSARCPHIGLSLARGKVVDGTITCPWHGSRFDIASGRNLDWTNALAGIPMPGWSHSLLALGKRPAPLTMFSASEKDGEVSVSGPAP